MFAGGERKSHMLKIEHLRKRFGNLVVLDDVNLSLNRGEVLSIIGQSGTGKSVVLKHIIGLLVPDGGQVLLDGEVVCSPTMKEKDFAGVRRRFGYLFQGAALFDSMTVGENLAFPLRERTDHSESEIAGMITEALSMVGLQAIESKMPAELSGGMRSRVGLARAIVMKPEIMLYDEPTSALDPIMSDKINDLVLELKQKLNMTSIVVTHDMSSAYKISDKIAMLYEGKIIFDGTPAQIRASRNPYIQQFISGRRKLHYAVTAQAREREAYNQQVDITRLQRKADTLAHLQHQRSMPGADNTTGLDGKESFLEQLHRTLAAVPGGSGCLTVGLVCVDRFRPIRDENPPGVLETILQGVATILRSSLRGKADVTARYDEETFAVLATDTDHDAARRLFDRIRESVAQDNIETPQGHIIPVTVSIGAVVHEGGGDVAPGTLLEQAHAALDAAHRRGTNRLVIAGEPSATP